MSVWVGSHGVRYTEEFRNIIYEINPVYLPCVYKEMFENYATNSLRDCDEVPEVKSSTKLKDSVSVKSTYCNYNKDCLQKIRCSSAVLYDQNNQEEFSGWEVCSKAHSATSVNCSKSLSEDLIKQRSQSASAKLNTPKNDTLSTITPSKVGKGRQLVDRFGVSRPSSEGGNSDSNAKLNDQQKLSSGQFSTPGYTSRSTSPIQYKFAHFEYPENYIEQYRQEYTIKKLNEINRDKSKTCVCGRIPSTIIPTVPIMPMFCTTEPCTQDSIKLRVTNSFHTDTKTIKARHEAAKKKPASKVTYITEQQQKLQEQRQEDCDKKSPHFLLAHNGVLKMEFYTNPLNIDNTQKTTRCKSNVVCRSRPSIPSNAHGHIYPSSATTPYRVYHKK